MKVNSVTVEGTAAALFGLGLSYGLTSGYTCTQDLYTGDDPRATKLHTIADKLAHQDGGHNKFLESIAVWIDVTAPRYWWQEFDTYRVGTTKQSESTMHAKIDRVYTSDDFEGGMTGESLERLNSLLRSGNWLAAKRNLPESFLQRRMVCTNYKVLRNMYAQRKNHRLPEWKIFFGSMDLPNKEWVYGIDTQ